MENPFRQKESKLDAPIDRLLAYMEKVEPDSEEYSKAEVRLERLMEVRREERGPRISPDTLAVVAGNLLGILVIVSYEHAHVVVSKAFGSHLWNRHNAG